MMNSHPTFAIPPSIGERDFRVANKAYEGFTRLHDGVENSAYVAPRRSDLDDSTRGRGHAGQPLEPVCVETRDSVCTEPPKKPNVRSNGVENDMYASLPFSTVGAVRDADGIVNNAYVMLPEILVPLPSAEYVSSSFLAATCS